MKNKLFTIAAALTVSATAIVSVAGAQTLPRTWSLRECIDYAVENNISIQQSALQVEDAALNLNTTQNSRLPSLNAGVNQNFSFGRMASEVDNSYVNTQASNTSGSVSLNVDVFNGFRINNQAKMDRATLGAATASLQRAKENLELNITGLYLDVLFKKEILAVYREQTSLTREQVANTRLMVEQGKVAMSQLYDIEAQLANDEVNEITAGNDLALALLSLEQALNLEHVEGGFDIVVPTAEELAVAGNEPLVSPESIYDTALGIKPEVRQAELRLESSQHQVRVAQSGYYPSLSLGGSVSDGYYHQFGQDYEQQSFSDQIRNKHSESVGLNLSIPLFNRNRTRNSVRSARLGVTNSTLELANVRLALYKEIQQAHQKAVSARERFTATTKALTAAEESFRAMEIRYNSGKATVFEYDQANTRLVSARSEQAQARYDFLFSARILDFYRGVRIDL